MSQEATVRTLYRTTDWLKMEKGVQHGCLLSPCLFNLYSGLDELQAGIKIGWRNINNFRHLDHITLMAESEGELKSLLMRVKESERAGLRLNIKKQRSWNLPPLLQTEGEKVEVVTDFLFLGSNITADGDRSHEIRR